MIKKGTFSLKENTSKKNDFFILVTKVSAPNKTKPNLQNRFSALFLMASPPVTRGQAEGGAAETQEVHAIVEQDSLANRVMYGLWLHMGKAWATPSPRGT